MRSAFLFIVLLLWSGWLFASDTTVKLLTIGNSFANDSVRYLEDIANGAGKKVILFRANLGGHSLEQHAHYLNAYVKDSTDPAGRPYRRHELSLVEALQLEKWDYVTLQQVSILSFRPETYEPHASTLIAAIRKYAPTAKILIHETWAYREDSKMFASGKLNQEVMYEGLHAAYLQLAENYQLKIIPVGTAFQRVRASDQWRYRVDTKYDFKDPVYPKIPEGERDLNIGWVWRKDKVFGPRRLGLDAKHANTAGCYLGGILFFLTLFPDAPESSFVPKGLAAENASFLRQVARETLSAFPQAKPESDSSPAARQSL